jgi:hypothetical protein
MEIWKDIPEYEGIYRISNTGKVFSVKRNRELKQTISHGYLKVRIIKNGKLRMMFVHRLVAMLFLEVKNHRWTIVNHKDRNRKNNNVDNLEWCDLRWNNHHYTINSKSLRYWKKYD